MTEKMRELYQESRSEHQPGMLFELQPHEWRTAKALERRGLIEVVGERGIHGHFEVRIKINSMSRESRLEEALRECIRQIGYLDEKFPATGTSAAVLTRARAVLEGEE